MSYVKLFNRIFTNHPEYLYFIIEYRVILYFTKWVKNY